MARRNGLERRVLAMLNDERRRRTPGWRDRIGPRVMGICGGAVIAVALPRPVAIPASVEAAVPVQAARQPSRTQPVTRAAREAPRRAARNDTTEALLGLAALLDDRNPIVRSTARDALHEWGGLVAAHLAPVARTDEGNRGRYARAALTAMEDAR
jgi:hypothetical protein